MLNIGKNLSIMEQVARINRELLKIAGDCEGPVGETLLTQAALIASEQRSLAPVDESSATPGALKESVRVEQGHPTPRHSIVIKIKAGGKETLKPGKDSKPYDYARGVEFGTQDTPARPFFYPIWRARKKDAKAAVRKAIRIAVAKRFGL